MDLHIVLLGHLQRKKERMQKFKETGNLRYIYQNELEKACFQYDIAYEDFWDLTRRIAPDKILPDKVFNIAKYHGYQRGIASMVYHFFDKRTFGSRTKNENISNKELAGKIRKLIIKKIEKRKVHWYAINK